MTEQFNVSVYDRLCIIDLQEVDLFSCLYSIVCMHLFQPSNCSASVPMMKGQSLLLYSFRALQFPKWDYVDSYLVQVLKHTNHIVYYTRGGLMGCQPTPNAYWTQESIFFQEWTISICLASFPMLSFSLLAVHFGKHVSLLNCKKPVGSLGTWLRLSNSNR